MEGLLIIEFFPVLFLGDLIDSVFGGGDTQVAVTTPQEVIVKPHTTVQVTTPVEAVDLTPIERAMVSVGALNARNFELSTAATTFLTAQHVQAMDNLLQREQEKDELQATQLNIERKIERDERGRIISMVIGGAVIVGVIWGLKS